MTPEPEDTPDRSLDTTNADAAGGAMNAAERVIERFGGIRPMASKLEIPVTTVQGWKKRGVIPAIRHSDIRAAASRHGVQLDPAELAAADPDEAEPAVSAASSAPEQAAPASHAAAPKRADGVGVAVLASVIAVIAAIAAATAPLWTPRLFPPRGPAADTAQQVQAFNDRLAGLEQRQPQDPSVRLGALEQAVASVRSSIESRPRDPAPAAASTPDPAVAERLARVEQRVEALPAAPVGPDPGLVERLGGVERRIEAVAGQIRDVQVSASQSAAAAQTIQALQGTVRELQRTIDEARRALSGLQARQDELAASLKQSQQQDMRAEAAVLALGHLRMALQNAEPFAGELATLRTLPGAPTQAVAAALESIAPYAASGAPTRAQLRERFQPLAGAIVRAGRSKVDASWTDVTLNRISSLVTVRRAPGEAEGNSVASVVARAEARLATDDLSGAVHALGALSGKAAEIAAPWLQQASARLALDQAAAEIARAAVARVGAGAQPAAARPAQ